MKTVPFFAVVLLLSLFAAGQVPDTKSKGMGAEVKAIHFDAANGSATVEVVNTSSRDITAYGIAYTIRYSDGQSAQAERMVEYLQGIITAQTQRGASWTGEGEFHAGESRQENFILGANHGNLAIGLDARIDVVIYSDRTADVQNEQVFQVFVSDRKGTAQVVAKASAILRDALSDSANPHPLDTASVAIQHLLDQPPDSVAAEGQLKMILGNLRLARESSSRGELDERRYIQNFLSERKLQAAQTKLHAEIGKNQ